VNLNENILRIKEIMGLNENLNLANKILKDRGISLENKNFKEAKEFLTKNNSIGYLGYALKMSSWDSNLSFIMNLVKFMVEKKELLKLLPKDISTYDDATILQIDINKIEMSRMLKKLTNKLTNKNLVDLLKISDISNWYDDIVYFLSIDSSDQKEFLSKTDKYKDVESFMNDLKDFVDDHKTGFTYGNVLKQINSMSDNDISVLYNSNDMILCKIHTYEASRKIGSTSWCIVGDRDQFLRYTQSGENFQYFFFNFNKGISPNLKMIAFTMNQDNEITASHDRYDNWFNGVINYLNSIGIKEKIFTLNSREFMKIKINKEIFINHYADEIIRIVYIQDKNKENEDFFVLSNRGREALNLLSFKILELLNETKLNHLDLILKKFENYPTYYINRIKNDYEKYKDYNVFEYMINAYDTIMHDDKTRLSKRKFIDVLKKIYQSSVQMKDGTKRSILFYLKNNDVDILKLSQLKKSKKGENLGGSEFGMLAKRGDNLKPIIQNKLGSIRRGEDVTMSDTEINYAIDNGYRDIIIKYYKEMLPDFRENQLSYEDMNIYKKLGMIKDVSDVIKSKADIYGIDSLNSIEKSLHDYSK